ncbi:phosphotransferase enzyme family protein [Thiospirillum jenense]|uniref:Aminoglycoside phosphotransferase family protein n=1 Tax=Thiospirillum jenense TaxID=1653858 RepID=A0A839HJC8_9GAMM|nr:aminoglycoside phosphotransferase family protein [Thiospirillum jenense]MBB1126719.1 aminoglycoside phosphotransferase family protein [Thiospirillum jenense]
MTSVVHSPPIPRSGIKLEHVSIIAAHFPVCHGTINITPFGQGFINDSYCVKTQAGEFVLQRINQRVFSAPERIMDNLQYLQQARLALGNQAPRLPQLFPAASGELAFVDHDGGTWRVLELIANSQTLMTINQPNQAREVGRTLAEFHTFVAQLPRQHFKLTLPTLHDSAQYLAQLQQRLAPLHTIQDTAIIDAISFINQRTGLIQRFDTVQAAELLPLRITHGDPKLTNILFDLSGQSALCLIDLDTIQPGLLLHDVADCVRSCCNRFDEDQADGQVIFDQACCRELFAGYFAIAAPLWTPIESAWLFDALRLLPLELGIRFLTDHLNGDQYFRVTEPGQNLLRARNQLALVAAIENQELALRTLINQCVSGY